MLSGLSLRSAFVFNRNSLLLSVFPLTSFHLGEDNLVLRAILKNWKPRFRFLLQQKDALEARLSWSLTICSFMALYSWMCSCLKISRNIFYLYLFTFLVSILKLTCFICTSWKRKQTMKQQSHRRCEWTKPKQKENKNKVT